MYRNKFEILTLKKPGITDFAKERNELLHSSESEWVFFVDTDEIVSNELKREVHKTIESGNGINGYYIYRKNYFFDRHIGTDKILRLARRDSGHWERKVHEVWNVHGRLGELKNPLIHHTAPSLHDFIKKTNNYSTLHAQANLAEAKRSDTLKIIIFPIAKFITSILMGRGFVFSMLQSFHSYLSWSKQYLLQKD
jgi:hypothetical protein